ncbi:MAG: sigma-E processing peptidase SpoIIGA [Sellimonas sp.]|uniref:sigma-E processing peptidase SpoIIGA n=1 Tax=Sellimonas sp. TaxID=2021466 RepID=UPI0039A35181
MYYEVYIDLLFLINFMMDYLLLLAVRKIAVFDSPRVRILPGALVGAFLTCLTVAVPLPAVVKMVCFHLLINSAMILTGLRIRSLRQFVRVYLMLYAGGFLLGGIFGFFRQYIRTGSLFFLFAVISYELLGIIWKLMRHMQRMGTYTCRIQLRIGDKMTEITGLFDTGNNLEDPQTGNPVCVVEKEAVKDLLTEKGERPVRYICCRSIGDEKGLLPLVKFDSLHISGEEDRTIEDVWIGISDTKISANGIYKMILNPDILVGGVK